MLSILQLENELSAWAATCSSPSVRGVQPSHLGLQNHLENRRIPQCASEVLPKNSAENFTWYRVFARMKFLQDNLSWLPEIKGHLQFLQDNFSWTINWNLQVRFFVVRKHCTLMAKWGNVLHRSAPTCERPGFGPRTRLREIIPANNCTMQGQNNWGNWGSLGVMKLWVAWEVLRWLMKFRELCSGGFHPKLVTPPYHGFLNVNTPPNSQNSKRH